MAKYITKPFEYIDNVVGVELNFNKVFYRPEILREVTQVSADLQDLENELKTLEKELAL
jgi:type I restriction enzyme M protein